MLFLTFYSSKNPEPPQKSHSFIQNIKQHNHIHW